MLGEGVISEVCLQKRLWRVKFQGSYWYGESDSNFTLHPGDRVRVVGTRNISLLVKPL
jgi:membrane protein implicated in regulation of membrane protease activity